MWQQSAMRFVNLCPAHTMRFLSSERRKTKILRPLTLYDCTRQPRSHYATTVFRRWHPGHGDPGGLVKCLIVIGLLMRRAPCLIFRSLALCDVDQVTAQTRSTVVGPIRFSNRSNNCRVVTSTKDGCRPRSHYAILRLSLSLRPTKDKNRIVWAGHFYIEKCIAKWAEFCRRWRHLVIISNSLKFSVHPLQTLPNGIWIHNRLGPVDWHVPKWPK